MIVRLSRDQPNRKRQFFGRSADMLGHVGVGDPPAGGRRLQPQHDRHVGGFRRFRCSFAENSHCAGSIPHRAISTHGLRFEVCLGIVEVCMDVDDHCPVVSLLPFLVERRGTRFNVSGLTEHG